MRTSPAGLLRFASVPVIVLIRLWVDGKVLKDEAVLDNDYAYGPLGCASHASNDRQIRLMTGSLEDEMKQAKIVEVVRQEGRPGVSYRDDLWPHEI